MTRLRRPDSVGLVVGILAGIWFASQVQRFTLAAYLGASSLMVELGITAATAGFLASIYFPVYGSLQIPSGIIADQGSPRRNLLISGVLMAASGLLFAFSWDAASATAARIAVGVSSAFIWLSMLKMAAVMPGGSYSRRLSLFIAVGAAGSVTGLAGLPVLLTALDWRATAAVVVVPTVSLTALLWLVRPHIQEQRRTARDLWHRSVARFALVPKVIMRTEYWPVFLVNMLWTGSQFAVLTWLPRYARDVLGQPTESVGVLAALAPLGQTFGSLAIGYLIGRRGASNLTVFFSCCIAYSLGLGVLASGALATQGMLALCLLVFAMGLAYGAFYISLAWVGQRSETSNLGTITGVLNGLGFLPAFVLPWIMGGLMDVVDNPSAAGWSYSQSAYSAAYWLVFAALAMGLALSFVISRRLPRQTGSVEPQPEATR